MLSQIASFGLYSRIPSSRRPVGLERPRQRSFHDPLPQRAGSPARPRSSRSGFGAAFVFAGAAHAEPKVLAKIDGVPITEDDVNDALEDIGPGLPQKLDGPARQQYALDYLIDMKLVAKKAAADKMDAGPAFARRMAYYHDKLAMEALLTDVAAKAATDEAEHKAYDEAAKAQPPVPEDSCAPYSAADRGRGQGRAGARQEGRGFRQGRDRTFQGSRAAKAAISAGSPRTRWCRNSPTPRSRWSPARFPIR